MKKIYFFTIISLFILACGGEADHEHTGSDSHSESFKEERVESDEMSLSEEAVVTDGSGDGQQNQAGQITAGEWNDLENWDFFQHLFDSSFTQMPEIWQIFPENRVSVKISDNSGNPIINANVKLKMNGKTVWENQTDNSGMAELWIDLFTIIPDEQSQGIDISKLSLDINNGEKVVSYVKLFSEGVNELKLSSSSNFSERAEICFIVDATGSMGDELEYLKVELQDVIKKVQLEYPDIVVATSSVFYRDKGDDYVTRKSAFTDDVFKTIDFIKAQSADGGGDFPEAVHSALDVAINDIQWSSKSKTRIIFFLLDAPPHNEKDVIENLHKNIEKSAKHGVKIIPIAASGIDKETEFLLRFMAVATNGTYVFITDDSGIGNSHLEATVGEYEVEFLNDLMVRLIGEYLK